MRQQIEAAWEDRSLLAESETIAAIEKVGYQYWSNLF